MTNYNERLDEIFNTLPVHGIISSDGIRDDYWDAVNARTKLKQAPPLTHKRTGRGSETRDNI